MDPYSREKNRESYQKYIINQSENAIDLREEADDPNDSIRLFAKNLFTKNLNLLKHLYLILLDDEMETVDTFSMLVELVLYGLDILSEGTANIFTLIDEKETIIDTINMYLADCKIKLIIDEVLIVDDIFIKNTRDDILKIASKYRQNDDYYCEILRKPSSLFCGKTICPWTVLSYRININNKFRFDNLSELSAYKSFFISDNHKLFTVKFEIIR